MSVKKNILISSVSLVLLIALAYLLSINKKDNNLAIRGGNVQLQKFNTPLDTTALKDDESYQDSVLYHKVVMDYGNYWQATNPLLKNKKVAFNRYSGKILIYINKNSNCFKDDLPADYVFSWDFDTIQPYKIKGIYGWTDKDTVMYWFYNVKKDVLIDEKGNIFKRIK
jgi:hypothetical protein